MGGSLAGAVMVDLQQRAFFFGAQLFLAPRLPGWRRSADRTSLHMNSLLSGNLTGKFVISDLFEPDCLAKNPCAAAFS
jgi:hypothetical protein